jgi:hypothetical protein
MKLTPYEQFSTAFESTVSSDKFTNDKISIFTLQTGGGKSHYQDTKMPLVLKNAFSDLKYIIRLSPTNEVAHDGTFEKVKYIDDKEYKFWYLSNPSEDAIGASQFSAENVVFCLSVTHGYFSHASHFPRFLELASKSVLCIEEAHQFTGCGDAGPEAYMRNFGFHSEYDATTMKRISEWMSANPRVLGFTATTTLHHESDSFFTEMFQVCSELAKLEDILPHQAWLDNVKKFQFVKSQGKNSCRPAVQNSIRTLFNREDDLLALQEYDPNINPKLSALFIAGNREGVWGCPIDEVKELIVEYLLDAGYEPNDKMIATMVEDSSSDGQGGIRIHDLSGNSEKVNSSEELFSRMQDPSDPVRFLVAINRCRSGINLHNLACEVICRVRRPKEVRTQIPIQIFGRMVRINVGTNNIIRKKYKNDIENYIKNYPKDYGVELETVLDTIRSANVYDIWYPEGDKKQTWKNSLDEFRELYANTSAKGFAWLEQFEPYSKPKPQKYVVECNHNEITCPNCGYVLNEDIDNWKGDGTLDRFFNISK